jgi:hypothetical protein
MSLMSLIRFHYKWLYETNVISRIQEKASKLVNKRGIEMDMIPSQWKLLYEWEDIGSSLIVITNRSLKKWKAMIKLLRDNI